MSRDAILGTIRRGLRRGELDADTRARLEERLRAPRRHLIPLRSLVPHAEQVAMFARHVEREFGTVTRVASGEDVPAAVADYLAAQNLPSEAAIGGHPELRALPWHTRPLLVLREGIAVGTDMVSIQHGFAGIAETGTLMLPSGPERPTTLNLLADTAIVVLRASRVVGPYEDAWDLLRREREGAAGSGAPDQGAMPRVAPGCAMPRVAPGCAMPRNVMLVTGPSRSADIEQTLELGAHGPRRLHVVLIDDAQAAGPGQGGAGQ